MQGPVGFRCKKCGTLAFDPLTSFTPTQLILGTGTALVAGVIAGFIASRIGFFSIFIAYFAGGFIAEAVTRVTGFKHGPVMRAIVLGGIAAGTLAGAIGAFWIQFGPIIGMAGADDAFPLQSLVVDAATWALLAAGAACVGAWSKLR